MTEQQPTPIRGDDETLLGAPASAAAESADTAQVPVLPEGTSSESTVIVPPRKPGEASKARTISREVTLQTFDRFPGGRPPTKAAAPVTGREATLGAGGGAESPETHAASGHQAVTGRESTLATPPPGLTGREATLATPPHGITGREATLATPPPGITGREATLATPPPGLTGREATLNDTPATGITGREATLEVGRERTPITIGAHQTGKRTPLTIAAGGATPTPATTMPGGKPRTGTGTSVSFDDAWHLEGRKGPFTGQTWGDFDLGGILGEGGMGAVYRAKQRSLKRRVAIKVLPPNLAADHRLLQRFQLEARTSSMLSSPHVVSVYAVGEHEGNHFYAMEFVQGTDLYDILKDRKDSAKRFTNDECVNYVIQAAKGLAEAGRHGVVHRDIKPPNLMVTKDGLVKITDFGIVKIMGEHNLTMTGQAVGTPAYVSPEQGRGESSIDQRSDLYSLGVVFYELATFEKPFKGTTPNALIYQHCYEEPELPKKLNPDLTDEVQAVVLKCLQKKPENRYQTAEELVRDLEAIRTGAMLKSALANFKLGTGADEAKREQMNWFQRNLVSLAAAAGIAVAAGGGAFWYLSEQSKAEGIAAATAKSEKALVQEKALSQIKPILAQFAANPVPVPANLDALLADYAKAVEAPDKDALYRQVADKSAKARTLAEALAAQLDAGAVDAAKRRSGESSLKEYESLVGPSDRDGTRWRKILEDLADDEKRLRAALASAIDQGTLDASTRAAIGGDADRLAAIVAGDDPALIRWRKGLADFDSRISGLFAKLAPLDAVDAKITEQVRQDALDAIAGLERLRSTDPRLTPWKNSLGKAARLLADLRERITRTLGNESVVPLPAIAASAGDLALYVGLVPADDADLKVWNAKVKASQDSIAAERTALSDIFSALGRNGAEPALRVAQTAPIGERVARLKALAQPGDADVIAWEETVRASRGLHEQLREQLEPLAPARREPLPASQQQSLATALKRFSALGGLDPAARESAEKRLAGEAKRIADLRSGLAAVLDSARSVGKPERDALDRLVQDVGDADPDAQRWRSKVAELDRLAAVLIRLDQGRGFPEDVDALFSRYETLVGSDDADVKRWRSKVETIRSLTKDLAPLDRPGTPIPADAARRLGDLKVLVGDDDPVYRRRLAKLDEVGSLTKILASLQTARLLSDAALADHEAKLRRLVELVGSDGDDQRAAAARISALAGPPTPWANSRGRDAWGPWAAADIAGQIVRLRWIAPGSGLIGSSKAESGDRDEVQVQMTLGRGLWLAETETTQALWSAVIRSNPSRFAGPLRPVERISWTDAQAFTTRLKAVKPDLPARLPTEAEWEIACRAGQSGLWAGRVEDPAVDKYAWTSYNSRGSTREVAGRYPNAHGLFDLRGNVWEWCQDGYATYPTGGAVDHVGRSEGQRVARGGSWGDSPDAARAANRLALDPEMRSAYLGLRLAVDAGWDKLPDGSERFVQTGGQRRLVVPLPGATITIDLSPAAGSNP
ncbi:hypothetical protein LBMAG53_05870 [Planctomycetota bacterium]|nr:hypothetical protein LBMAG53_05870 [Planctomycetota bacterium]